MNLGDTFLWSPNGGTEHLYIAVTDPQKNRGNFVAFNLTKSKGGPKALTFRIGEHPFITKYDSDVAIGDGLIPHITRIKRQIAIGRAFPHKPMDLAMVKRIALFAIGHPAVSGDIQKLIKSEWKS
jgi:hypothetical protein